MITLEFVPYADIENLDSHARINKLLSIVKQEKIILMQGRLKPEEETLLISETMSQIKDKFRGVELCTIFPEEKNLQFFNKFKKEMVKALIGHRDGVTIIGPSSVVKEIRKNPNKVELFTLPSAARLSTRSKTRSTKKARSFARKKRRR